VVSTGARTLALFGFQSPGDYATFNSNHTPDGTTPLPKNFMSIVQVEKARPSDIRLLLQKGHRFKLTSMRLFILARRGLFGVGRGFVTPSFFLLRR
jgi:hypothetical protein